MVPKRSRGFSQTYRGCLDSELGGKCSLTRGYCYDCDYAYLRSISHSRVVLWTLVYTQKRSIWIVCVGVLCLCGRFHILKAVESGSLINHITVYMVKIYVL